MTKTLLALLLASVATLAQAHNGCRTVTYHARVLDVEDLHQEIVLPDTATRCDHGQCTTSVTAYKTFETEPRFQVTIAVKGATTSFESPVEPTGATVPVQLRECGKQTVASTASAVD